MSQSIVMRLQIGMMDNGYLWANVRSWKLVSKQFLQGPIKYKMDFEGVKSLFHQYGIDFDEKPFLARLEAIKDNGDPEKIEEVKKAKESVIDDFGKYGRDCIAKLPPVFFAEVEDYTIEKSNGKGGVNAVVVIDSVRFLGLPDVEDFNKMVQRSTRNYEMINTQTGEVTT